MLLTIDTNWPISKLKEIRLEEIPDGAILSTVD
jgi:hypothetical protein